MRVLRSLVSIFLVTTLTYTIIYTMVPRKLIFKQDTNYNKIATTADKRDNYENTVYERMGYIEYYDTKELQEKASQMDASVTVEANDTNKAIYEKYAVAQAWLTDNALTIPVMASPKETAVSYVSKVLPFSSSYSVAGLKGENAGYLKYTEVGEKAITKEEYEKAREKWLKEKTESNEKAQKELASHVK